MSTAPSLIGLIVGTLIAIGIFFALREVFCWYYKINERIHLQKETNRLLKELTKAIRGD